MNPQKTLTEFRIGVITTDQLPALLTQCTREGFTLLAILPDQLNALPTGIGNSTALVVVQLRVVFARLRPATAEELHTEQENIQ